MTEVSKCPKCGADLPANAPAGLCPKCLMGAALKSESAAQANERTSEPSASTVDSPSSTSRFLPPTPGELAGRFPQLEILELLGQGGMGAVYKARQTNLDRLVALKIIRPEATHYPELSERFAREAKTLARLNHPHIVAIYEFSQIEYAEADGQPPRPLFCFLMEYVDGANLRQLMQAGELSPEQALAIVPQICEALQYAHDEGVIHRDIKPENVLIDKRGRVKIADFGLAKLAAPVEEELTLTGTHQVMGTLRYMAPEQMESSHAVDHRADIYSLGAVFYEMLTGEAPMGHFEPPSKKVHIDVRLDEVVLRALAREPERRYQHASDVKTAVELISRSGSEPGRPPWASQPNLSTCDQAFVRLMTGRRVRQLAVASAVITSVLVGAICYARGYKPAFVEISDAMWAILMTLVFAGFLLEALLYPGKSKGLRAAFPLICGLMALLVYIAVSPQSLLDSLYRFTNQPPGKGDRMFLRVVIALLLCWLAWQAVQVRRKLLALEQLEQGKDHKPEKPH